MNNPNEYTKYNEHLSKTYVKKDNYSLYNNYYRKNILNFLPKNKNAKISDLGCGLGQMLYFLRKNQYKNIEGIDINKENADYCRKKGFEIHQKSIIKYLKDLNDKKDAFILSNVLEHFSCNEIVRVLSLIFKKLNENGTAIIIIPNCNNIYGLATYFSDITHKSPLNEKSFEEILALTSFKKYTFNNLIIYPNIYFIDSIFKIINKISFIKRKMLNIINGQKPYKVQSKNLLIVLEK